jgi:hypothetical protein
VSGEGEQAGGEGGVAGGAGTSERAPPAPANPEEISLDDDEEGGAQGAGHPAADGGEGGEAGPSRGAGGAAAVGPEPANVVFPSEIPVHFRRGPRRWVGGGMKLPAPLVHTMYKTMPGQTAARLPPCLGAEQGPGLRVGSVGRQLLGCRRCTRLRHYSGCHRCHVHSGVFTWAAYH